MRIKLYELRKIIRSVLREQGWVPGRWYPGSGEPVEDSEIESMGRGGLDQDEEDNEDESQI